MFAHALEPAADCHSLPSPVSYAARSSVLLLRSEDTHGLQPGSLRRGMRSAGESIGSGGEEANRTEGGHRLHRFAGSGGQDRVRGTGPRPAVRPAGEEMDSEAEREGPRGPSRISVVFSPQRSCRERGSR